MRTCVNVTGQILVPTLISRENGLIEADSPLLTKVKGKPTAVEAEGF
jgi:Na+/H+-dicarboxylate symporter